MGSKIKFAVILILFIISCVGGIKAGDSENTYWSGYVIGALLMLSLNWISNEEN